MRISLMKENEFGLLGKAFAVLVVVGLTGGAVLNLWRGEVAHPELFGIALAGLALFTIAKLSIFAQGRWLSFGTKHMSPAMANAYRAGYWLMFVGAVITFV
jgi:hypothetical protein